MADNLTIEGRKFPKIPDVQRSWLWELFIPNVNTLKLNIDPNFLEKFPMDLDDDDLSIRCRTITIPSISFEKYEANYLGFVKQFPIKKKINTAFTTEFEEFEDQKIIRFIYGWQSIILNHDPKSIFVGHTAPTYPSRLLYTKNIYLRMFSYDGKNLKKIVFHNAWPSNISDVSLSYTGNESVKYNVEWSYDYWTLE